MIECTVCQTEWKLRKRNGARASPPFVCRNCRCTDCQIVLNTDCTCGERHGKPSRADPRLCEECERIRDRVAGLDPELLRLRELEFNIEDPLYT